jgi:hypothetical protein
VWGEVKAYVDKRFSEHEEAVRIVKAAESVAKEAVQSAEVEKRLEAGAWKEAASKRCDYWRDAPADLVETVRKAKGGVTGQTHHFTASATEPTLFRFKRGSKA